MGEVDHSRDAEAEAILDKVFEGFCKLEYFEEDLARAVGLAADLDGAFRRCPKRACRKAGRCCALLQGAVYCSAPFGPRGRMAFDVGVRLVTRLHLAVLEETPGARIKLD